jgi:CheY-like chemotaxis protein
MSEQPHKTAMVVDDDGFMLEMYSKKLSEEGFGVETAAKGEDALDLLRKSETPPVCVLVDLAMPGMSGFDLLQCMREEGLARDAVIIAFSNLDDDTDKERAMQHDIDAYLVKANYTPSEVVEQITELLNAKM